MLQKIWYLAVLLLYLIRVSGHRSSQTENTPGNATPQHLALLATLSIVFQLSLSHEYSHILINL